MVDRYTRDPNFRFDLAISTMTSPKGLPFGRALDDLTGSPARWLCYHGTYQRRSLGNSDGTVVPLEILGRYATQDSHSGGPILHHATLHLPCQFEHPPPSTEPVRRISSARSYRFQPSFATCPWNLRHYTSWFPTSARFFDIAWFVVNVILSGVFASLVFNSIPLLENPRPPLSIHRRRRDVTFFTSRTFAEGLYPFAERSAFYREVHSVGRGIAGFRLTPFALARCFCSLWNKVHPSQPPAYRCRVRCFGQCIPVA